MSNTSLHLADFLGWRCEQGFPVKINIENLSSTITKYALTLVQDTVVGIGDHCYYHYDIDDEVQEDDGEEDEEDNN